MITVTKGNAILQMPCGCNSRKFKILLQRLTADEEENQEQFDADMEEISELVENHNKICWSK